MDKDNIGIEEIEYAVRLARELDECAVSLRVYAIAAGDSLKNDFDALAKGAEHLAQSINKDPQNIKSLMDEMLTLACAVKNAAGRKTGNAHLDKALNGTVYNLMDALNTPPGIMPSDFFIDGDKEIFHAFNFEKEIQNLTKQKGLKEIFDEFHVMGVPYFFCAAVADDGQETKYLCEFYTPTAAQRKLTYDRFPDYINVNNGFVTVINPRATNADTKTFTEAMGLNENGKSPEAIKPDEKPETEK